MPVLAPKYGMTFGSAESLTVLADRYQFFTPALPYAFGGLTDQPLLDFLEAQSTPNLQWQGHFLFHRFRYQIFNRLNVDSDTNWNYVLWAMEKRYYPAFENFMCGVVLSDFARRRLCKPAATDIRILDPLAVDLHGILPATPVLPIVALGVDGSEMAIAMRQPADVLISRPGPQSYPPRPSTVQLAKAVFAEDQSAVVAAMPVPVLADITPTAAPLTSDDVAKSLHLYQEIFRTR